MAEEAYRDSWEDPQSSMEKDMDRQHQASLRVAQQVFDKHALGKIASSYHRSSTFLSRGVLSTLQILKVLDSRWQCRLTNSASCKQHSPHLTKVTTPTSNGPTDLSCYSCTSFSLLRAVCCRRE